MHTNEHKHRSQNPRAADAGPDSACMRDSRSSRRFSTSDKFHTFLSLRRLAAAAVLIVSVGFALTVDHAAGATLTVGGGGYNTINAAVSAASSGDTIRVHAGTYAEEVELSKNVTVTDFGDGAVWVDGSCSRNYGIDVSGNGATVEGIGVRRANEAGVRVYYADNVTLDNMTIQDYNCANGNHQYMAGVASWGGGSGLTVTDNTIIRRAGLSGSPYGYGNGIWIKNTSSSDGGGHTITGNTIIGGYDGIGGEPEDATYGSFYRDTTIANNEIRDCWDDGIQVEGGDINIVVENNLIDGCAIGIAFAPNKQGPLYIRGNEIYNLEPGFYGSRYAFKIGDGSGGITYLEDNIIITQGDGLKQSNSGVGPIISRGNVFSVSRYVIEISSSIPGATDFDYDCLWTSDSSRFVKWGGSTYSSLSQFHNATGHEEHGVESSTCASSPPSPPNPTPTPPKTPTPTPPPPPGSTPTPTPTPIGTPVPPTTPTPLPTPTPPGGSTPVITPTPGEGTPPGGATPIHDQAEIQGDADGDGDVDILDSLAILQYVAGTGGHPMDVTCDNQTHSLDALAIMRYLVGLPVFGLPPGCPTVGTVSL